MGYTRLVHFGFLVQIVFGEGGRGTEEETGGRCVPSDRSRGCLAVGVLPWCLLHSIPRNVL